MAVPPLFRNRTGPRRRPSRLVGLCPEGAGDLSPAFLSRDPPQIAGRALQGRKIPAQDDLYPATHSIHSI
jgi:hypothetical protein